MVYCQPAQDGTPWCAAQANPVLPGLGPLRPWALLGQALVEVRYLLLELRQWLREAPICQGQHPLPGDKEAVGSEHTGLGVPAQILQLRLLGCQGANRWKFCNNGHCGSCHREKKRRNDHDL